MASMRPAHSRLGADEDEEFGWQLFFDRQRNLVYYLHSYTGEVRWPRPETVGFVMHGLKPLPAHTMGSIDARTDSNVVNPDIWSPYYPHVVMLPSGLMQVHPGPDAGAQGATEMWCGYNRFPLRGYAAQQSRARAGPRMLPPTWEDSRSGSPFLPPYPVAVLGRGDSEEKRPAPAPLQPVEQAAVDPPRSYRQIPSGELGRVQGSMDWSAASVSSTPATDRKQSAHVKGPNTEKKEHNRKGYLLRQARKLTRDGSSSSVATSVPASTKQRKSSEAGRDFSTRAPEDTNLDAYGDYDRTSPLYC